MVAASEGESYVVLKSFFLSLSCDISFILDKFEIGESEFEDSDLALVWILSKKLLAREFCSRLSCCKLLPNLRY